VFLGIELQQNNALLSAQARAERASVSIDANTLSLSNPELMRIRFKAENGEELTEQEDYWMEEWAWGTFIRWQYVWGEYDAGLIDREFLPTKDWRLVLDNNPVLMRFWRESGAISYRPDFIQFMNAEVLNNSS